MITSGSNQHIQLLRTLHTPKGREQHGAFLMEGPHLLEAAFEAGITPLLIVYEPDALGKTAEGRRLIGRIEAAAATGAQVFEAAPAAIERAADTRTPRGVVTSVASADVAATKVRARRRGRMRPILLVLDAISDPGNLGTILRTALAADADEVVLAPGCADPLNPKVVRAGAGAHFRMPVQELASWQAAREVLHGAPAVRQVLAAESSGRTAYTECDLTLRTALIIGNEAHGLSPEAQKLTTLPVSIPMYNRVESLNAAVAASVILFEAARQRRAAEREGRETREQTTTED
ncbi:MAG TPA: RNA methyltransferase [Ktedonobacterales bacterium]|nr:RNA methyltransferase [Ktedonobacterales bacterium]